MECKLTTAQTAAFYTAVDNACRYCSHSSCILLLSIPFTQQTAQPAEIEVLAKQNEVPAHPLLLHISQALLELLDLRLNLPPLLLTHALGLGRDVLL